MELKTWLFDGTCRGTGFVRVKGQAEKVERTERRSSATNLVPEIAKQLKSFKEVSYQQTEVLAKSRSVHQHHALSRQASVEERLTTLETFFQRLTGGCIRRFAEDLSNFAATDSRPSRSGSTQPEAMEIEPRSERSLAWQLVPAYMVNTGLKSVDEVLEEWDQGLISGPDGSRSPSIRHLEHTYKTSWRKGTVGQG